MTFYIVLSILLEYIWKMINRSHRWTKRLVIMEKICNDCFKEKKFIAKYIRFFFYCTVCLTVKPFSHTSEEKNYWNMIVKKKIWSFISFIYLVIMSYSYSEIKDVIQAIFSFFALATATPFNFLR